MPYLSATICNRICTSTERYNPSYSVRFPPRAYSTFHNFSKSPLPIATNDILLHPADWPKGYSSKHAKPRRDKLPREDEKTQNAERTGKLDPFIDLIQIILGLNVVYIVPIRMMRRRIRLRNKLKNCRQSDRSAEVRYGPDAEDLVHCDVETEGLDVKGYTSIILATGLSKLQCYKHRHEPSNRMRRVCYYRCSQCSSRCAGS